MTVAELMNRLKDYHPETLVVMDRPDIFFDDIRRLRSDRVIVNEQQTGLPSPHYTEFYSGKGFAQSFVVVVLSSTMRPETKQKPLNPKK